VEGLSEGGTGRVIVERSVDIGNEVTERLRQGAALADDLELSYLHPPEPDRWVRQEGSARRSRRGERDLLAIVQTAEVEERVGVSSSPAGGARC
jgi:hypothetical protein